MARNTNQNEESMEERDNTQREIVATSAEMYIQNSPAVIEEGVPGTTTEDVEPNNEEVQRLAQEGFPMGVRPIFRDYWS